jgi:hypothetical protein
MVQFGKELSQHTARSVVPAEHYVNYKQMKKALRSGASDAELQQMYMSEMHKIIDRLAQFPETLQADPDYVETNRRALDKISKKLDKKRKLQNRQQNRELVTRHLEQTYQELLQQGLVDPALGRFGDLRALGGAMKPQGSGGGGGSAVFLAGAAAGAASRTLTAPLNLVKLRLQGSTEQGAGLRSCLRAVHSEGGPRAFWRGNGANVLKIMPESAVRFVMYEELKALLAGARAEKSAPGAATFAPYERFLCGSIAGGLGQVHTRPPCKIRHTYTVYILQGVVSAYTRPSL